MKIKSKKNKKNFKFFEILIQFNFTFSETKTTITTISMKNNSKNNAII